MPPKKKSKEPVQTKLSFKPLSASSPATLFTVESAAPLRSHMSILNNKDNVLKATTSTPSVLSQYEQQQPPTKPISNGVSTVPQRIESLQVGGNNSQHSSGQRKRKTSEEPMYIEENSLGSIIRPLDLNSDSEDELLKMPSASYKLHTSAPAPKPSETTSPSASRIPGSLPATATVAPKLSLLEQMATPKGTKPIPRASELISPKADVGYRSAAKLAAAGSNSNLSSSRPLLVSSGSILSDDGFVSATSLDNRMQGRFGGYDPEITPPLSQGSSNGGSQQSSQQQSLHAKVQSYSQKRSGDFAAYSVGGTRKRVLPPTITGYQPISTFQTGVHVSSKVSMASLSRTTSFHKTQDSDRTAPQPSSPGSAGARLFDSSSAYGATDYPKNMTKDGMLLSAEQQHVLKQVMDYKKNVFFTGSAGTGKSVLLRELIYQLRSRYSNRRGGSDHWGSTDDAVAVTASTGIAACNIGGCTLHSFAGVGLGLEALPALQAKIRKNLTTVRRWQDTKVLIIDEVSMIDADFMDKLEALARFVRKDDRPWGGIQVVLTGDFFQLPPVNKSGNVKFCFECESWSRTIHTTIQLQQVFRQKDQTFADMLNEMRLGLMSPPTIDRFRTLTRDLKTNDGLRPTELFPLRNQVEEANNRMLNNLPGKTVVYQARDRGALKEKMEQNCLAPTTLQLKMNAQVMLLRNQGGGSGGLVNGSLGILIGFVSRQADNENPTGSDGARKGSLNTPGEELPLVRFTVEGGGTREMVVGREEWTIELPNGDVQGARIQIPLGLAWSLSIHKSQGQTLPKVKVDLGKVFEKGQAYVALSRATTLDGLQVLNFDPRKVMVHPKVTEFYRQLRVYKAPEEP